MRKNDNKFLNIYRINNNIILDTNFNENDNIIITNLDF